MAMFFRTAMQPAVYRTAIRISLLIGTVLALINHSPAIFSLTLSSQNVFQIVLTYLVPYGVSTYSAVKAIRETQNSSS
jgi:hypothetical protein